MATVNPATLPPEVKLAIAAVAAYLAAHKADCEKEIAPYITEGENAIITFAGKEVGYITNPFLKMAAEWVVSTYGPQLPAFVSQYEGSLYDKFVAFLQEISK